MSKRHYVHVPESGYENADQVKTTLAHMCGAGATYAMILEALQDTFTAEARISLPDNRRLAYENAADSMADATAELDRLEWMYA